MILAHFDEPFVVGLASAIAIVALAILLAAISGRGYRWSRGRRD